VRTNAIKRGGPAVAVLIVLSWGGAGRAGIAYDPGGNVMRVTDFPAGYPCTMERLAVMDRTCGWGKVRPDPASGAYVVDCDLVIGAVNGAATHFVVRPGETVRMGARLVVRPAHVPGPGRTGGGARVNRLTVGATGQAGSPASLLLAPGDGKTGGGLFACASPWERPPPGATGAEVHVGRAVISCASPGQDTAYVNLLGARIVLKDTTISRLAGPGGVMLYGVTRETATVESCIFENGRTGVYNSGQRMTGCTFRGFELALNDAGSLDAELVDCTFADNVRNWALLHSRWGLTLIDCTWEAPRQNDVYRCWQNPRTGKKQYPCFTGKRHVIVQVLDAGGRPAPNARVVPVCEQGAAAIGATPSLTTGPDGRTPGRGAPDALLLTEVRKQATDVLNRPAVQEYSYRIQVSAEGGRSAVVAGFRPQRSWEVVEIVLPEG